MEKNKKPKQNVIIDLTMQEVLSLATKEYRRKRAVSSAHTAAMELLLKMIQTEASVGVPAGILARHVGAVAVRAIEQNLKFEKEKYEKAKDSASV